MNRANARKLILSNALVALIALFIWMITSGLDVTNVYGATRSIPYTYDIGVFNITDLSIKDDDYSPSIIGFIENIDPLFRTIKGVSLKIEMYDGNNHLIDVAESGYSSTLPGTIVPAAKTSFKIPIDKNNDLDRIHIEIRATDWGTPNPPPAEGPYLGIDGLVLTPNIAQSIGSNQTQGVLITDVAYDSPANNYGLPLLNGTFNLEGYDIITKIDNKTVSNMVDLKGYIISKQVNDLVHFTIIRDNATKEVDIKLGNPPTR